MAGSGAVALFIDTMTGSKTLVGLAITLQALFLIIGQLLAAPFVQTIRDLPKMLFFSMTIQRIIPLIMAVPLFFGIGAYPAVIVFLALYGLFWMGDGIVSMPWSELTARALLPELRGHMMGMQVAVGGGVSLLTGLLLTWLLATPVLSDNSRYGFIFILTSAILLLSIIFIRLVKDPKPISFPEKVDFIKYYIKIPTLLKESKPLQRALIARIPGYVGFSVITFMVVFSANTLDISEAQVSWLVYSQIAGGLIGGIIVGEASRRIGNKAVIILCNAGVFITIIMAVVIIYFPFLGYIWLVAICVTASLCFNSWVGYMNYMMDIAPRENRPAYVVIGNCIGIPFSFIGYGIGAVIDEWGYTAAFVLGVVCTIFAILTSCRLLSRKQIKALELEV
ncbi:MAG: MFS transporter [Oscillospiraceae bacterium]|jgi:MFS family permease|nr:MFS transporter [Oscillospiraceae bacterium]